MPLSTPRIQFAFAIFYLLTFGLLLRCADTSPEDVTHPSETCAVEPGLPHPVTLEFRNACLAGLPTALPRFWIAEQGMELVEVRPDALTSGTYQLSLVTCEIYDIRIEWKLDGADYTIYSVQSAETFSAYQTIELRPIDGCPDPGPGEYTLADCVNWRINEGTEQAAAEYLCCLDEPFASQVACR